MKPSRGQGRRSRSRPSWLETYCSGGSAVVGVYLSGRRPRGVVRGVTLELGPTCECRGRDSTFFSIIDGGAPSGGDGSDGLTCYFP